jgi:hypothetical protein
MNAPIPMNQVKKEVIMNDIEPTLYLFGRTDIQDMNPGKLAAQTSHATDDFNAWKQLILSMPDQYVELIIEFATWQEDRNFGRVIVLEATLEQMEMVNAENDFAGLTTDPTYPWRNYYGELFLTEEVTSGWCFMCNQTVPSESLKTLSLHR